MKQSRSLSTVLLACTVLWAWCQIAYGQFPRACATTEALSTGVCCPPINGVGSSCGEAEGRGVCSDIAIDNSTHGPPYALENIDDREKWPSRFYNRSCRCLANFGGFDCSSCKHGWGGEDCSEKLPVNVRKNILDMTEAERNQFLDVLDQSKTAIHPDYVIAREHYRSLLGVNGTGPPDVVDVSIYNLFVWTHYFSVRDTLLGPGQAYTDVDFSHKGPAFLTWHRYHLLTLEADLQKLSGDPTLAIPYWDFANGGFECDICTDELLGGRDPEDPTLLSRNSRFADWQVICLDLEWFNNNIKLCNGTLEGPIRRNPGGNVERLFLNDLPKADDVSQCVQLEQYDTLPYYTNSTDSFRNSLEGYAMPDGEFEEGVRTLHNLAHLFLNGTGSITHASANDPIFVLLHSYTDAIFDEWLTRTNATLAEYPDENAPMGHNLKFNMAAFFPPVTNAEVFIPAEQLGYSYSFRLPEVASSFDSTPSFLWAIVGVAGFVVLAAFVLLIASGVTRHRQRQREEGLYKSLILEDGDRGLNYTA